MDLKSTSPETYAPSYLSDDETVVPNGYSYFGDDKKGMSGYSSSDDDEPFNPNGGSATNYWSELLAPETVVVMPGNPLTVGGLAEEILRQANVGSATEEANYWNTEPEKRSSEFDLYLSCLLVFFVLLIVWVCRLAEVSRLVQACLEYG